MPRSEVLRAIFLWWIGETIGVLTVTPFLLIHVMPWLKRFAEEQPVSLPIRWLFRPMYLITLPLIWIALDHGLKGITTGIVVLNFGVTLAMWFFRFDLARLGELQLLMIVNCIVGLLMGAVVTERKRAEEEIRRLNADLEQRVEARTRELRDTQEQLVRQERLAVLGQLAGGVGHELRNPLTIINNAVYFLKLVQPDANEKIKEYLGLIDIETHTAEKIITDLLDFARIKSVDPEPVSVSELVQRVLERYPPTASVTVTQDFPPGLPKFLADPRQMEQVLGNLTVNACQAMPEGGELTFSARQEGVDGRHRANGRHRRKR